MKEKLLVLPLAFMSFQSPLSLAVPFFPIDARATGMGGTGTASARTVHAPSFNPALMAFSKEEDDVGIILPQFGVSISDEEELFDSVTDFVDADYIDVFEESVDAIEFRVDNITNSFNAINNAIDADDLASLQTQVTQLNSDADSLTNGTSQLRSNTQDLTTGLSTLSDKAVSGGVGLGFAIAIPTEAVAVAIVGNSQAFFSGVSQVTQADLNTINNYAIAADQYANAVAAYSDAADAAVVALNAFDNAPAPATAEALAVDAAQLVLTNAKDAVDNFSYGGSATAADDGDKVIFENGSVAANADDVTLSSQGHFVGVQILEVGLSFAKSMQVDEVELSWGVTPKYQRVRVYDYIYEVENDDDIEIDDITDTEKEYTDFNVDVGVAARFGEGGNIQVGAVIKNLIENDYETILGRSVELKPLVRIAGAYKVGGITIAGDIDLTENSEIAFEEPTQFAGLGVEMDAFSVAQLRLGYRVNLSDSDNQIVTAGFGFSPFGIHFDLAAFANIDDAEKGAGFVAEFGIDW